MVGFFTGVSLTMSIITFIYFSFILGNVSWAVAAILMGFTAAAAFGMSLCLQAFDAEDK